jgi:hypothetical protein
MKDMEKDLIKVYNKIFPFYYGDPDSLEYYSSLFTTKITNYIKDNPSTLDYPFQSLIDSNCCWITTSKDGSFRIYSWDMLTGGTMHFFNSIYQWKSNGKVFIYTPTFGEDGFPSTGFYTEIFTLHANNKTYYLTINNGSESSTVAYQGIDIISLENGSFNDTIQLIKTKEGFTNSILLECDINKYNGSERPVKLIKYDENKKIIYIPIIFEDGTVTDRYILYQFTGEYFEHILTQKSPSDKPNN